MTTKYQGTQVLKQGQRRWLARKLSEVHKLYLAALGLTSLVFTKIFSADVSPKAAPASIGPEQPSVHGIPQNPQPALRNVS